MHTSLAPHLRGLRRTRLAAIAVACGALVVGSGAATPAAAAHHSPISFGHHRNVKNFQDSNWGGYVATGNFTSISGSWTEPQVTCNTSNDLYAPWVGIDGYGSESVEQTGVQTDCSSGSPVYSAWYEMYPAQPVYWNDPVSAGDSFTGSVADSGGGNYTITLTDNTAGWTETTQQQYNGQDASAEAVIESPTSSYPSFSQQDFSNVTVDGQVFDSTNPQALTSGGYGPTALSNGSFSMEPGAGFKARK
ncbi:G1 family glutamic endopeptidase [Catenulispora pinisilvae]|uniref:G1 family glutamic endopeptidase n=1 Tax=Catenulispora pinisilvae TaxID=2705253 RepID=UPI001890C08C|nr:G1 family glutamic endopeptidase [Catenulispora pinisilvae]